MQHDDIIWRLLKDSFCSFRAKIKKEKQAFCRNPYSCTGLCNKRTCPLANSKYATLREEDGNIFLYMKTVERAHTPRDLWEKIKLPRNYTEALKIIDGKLQYSPLLNHKNKQRLTRIHQCLIRMRRLKRSIRPQREVIRKKIERRDAHREIKALRAAHIENSIEAELLERLKKGTYGDIYNFPEQEFNDIIDVNEEETEQEKAEEAATEFVEDFEPSDDEIEDYANFEGATFGESGLEEEDGDEGEDNEEDDDQSGKKQKPKKEKPKKKPKKGKGGKKKHMEIEYEDETEDQVNYNK